MIGFIKLHRKLMQWEWYNKSEMVHLFIHLLISANSKDKPWQGIVIKRGQVVTGYNKLSKETGISIRTLRTCFNRLKSTGELSLKTTNKYSVLTILKYNDYNDIYDTTDKQNDKQPVTLPTTTKNNKKKEYINSITPDNKLSEKKLDLISREKLFREELIPFAKSSKNKDGIYEADMVGDFYNYWREPTQDGKKMRFERQATWSTKLRLITWNKNALNKKPNFTRKLTAQEPNPNDF